MNSSLKQKKKKKDFGFMVVKNICSFSITLSVGASDSILAKTHQGKAALKTKSTLPVLNNFIFKP